MPLELIVALYMDSRFNFFIIPFFLPSFCYFFSYHPANWYRWSSLEKIIFYFLRFYLFIFREWGMKEEEERNINVWLPLACPLLGTWLATQACALTGNWTGDLLVCRPTLSPLSHTSQGWKILYSKKYVDIQG